MELTLRRPCEVPKPRGAKPYMIIDPDNITRGLPVRKLTSPKIRVVDRVGAGRSTRPPAVP
jgi:hypothetical protein